MDINQAIAQLDWQKEPRGLYEPIAYTLASGGKRLRPTLALLGTELFGGKEEEVLPAALALEVFHNFTLLHDDVMDRADVRRGRATVHVKWNDNTAILSGDQMMIEAYKLLGQVKEDKLPQVLRWFNQMATEICEGQQYDVDYESREDVRMAEYTEMIRLKTSVLLGNALQTGAYIAGADQESTAHLYNYGIHLGLAFQIQDDLLDVYGDEKTFGKAIGGDILCGKKSFMLLTALHTADAQTKEELKYWLARRDAEPKEKIRAVTALYDRLDVRSEAEKAIREHTDAAINELSYLPANAAREQLQALAEKLANRSN
ncbi:MAG: polyprenyl synthetase family protein [Paludibacteraceae bacterium]|nr:polyprenyl synthetase family protein [Paludibacteraceae bacterium]